MSVMRQGQFYGQMRIDSPHLRALDSSVAADFDLLAGAIVAGQQALVVKGFELSTVGAVGASVNALTLNTAGGTLLHPLASASGTMFTVDGKQAPDVLTASNPRLVGGFTANAINYVSIALKRVSDPDSADLIQFLDAKSLTETPRTLPLARILDYTIVVSTVEFGATPHLCPVAKITTDTSNVVSVIQDARQLLFRLGSGGTSPDDVHAYAWPNGRIEGSGATLFHNSDKTIGSLKAWLDAAMTRMWEVGGGEHWYSATTDRDVKIAFGSNVFASGRNANWNAGTTTLEWQDLSVVFANSTATFNDIADGSAVIGANQCLYVDIDRKNNRTGGTSLVPQVADLATLGSPAIPGSRFIIAWRKGTLVYLRDYPFEVNREFGLPAQAGDANNILYEGSSGGPLWAPPVVDYQSILWTTPTHANAIAAATALVPVNTRRRNMVVSTINTATGDVLDLTWTGSVFTNHILEKNNTGLSGPAIYGKSGSSTGPGIKGEVLSGSAGDAGQFVANAGNGSGRAVRASHTVGTAIEGTATSGVGINAFATSGTALTVAATGTASTFTTTGTGTNAISATVTGTGTNAISATTATGSGLLANATAAAGRAAKLTNTVAGGTALEVAGPSASGSAITINTGRVIIEASATVPRSVGAILPWCVGMARVTGAGAVTQYKNQGATSVAVVGNILRITFDVAQSAPRFPVFAQVSYNGAGAGFVAKTGVPFTSQMTATTFDIEIVSISTGTSVTLSSVGADEYFISWTAYPASDAI